MQGLTRVVMRLGRNPEAGFPDGDDRHGYVVVAPLDKDGLLDSAVWAEKKEACTVRRFHALEAAADGWLRRRGDNWYFWYDEADEGPEEPLIRLASHRLIPGEYVTVREGHGAPLTFRITEAVRI